MYVSGTITFQQVMNNDDEAMNEDVTECSEPWYGSPLAPLKGGV